MNRLLRISFDTLLTSATPILGWFLLGILVDKNLINIFSLIYPMQFVISSIQSIFGTGANISAIKDKNKESVFSGIVIGSIIGMLILGSIALNIDKYILLVIAFNPKPSEKLSKLTPKANKIIPNIDKLNFS